MADFPSPYWYLEQNDTSGTGIALRLVNKIVEKQSPFQKVEVYQTTDFGYLMVIDGSTMLSSLDSFFYHEMMVHPALFSHPNPHKVLIIGGGNCGILQQVLKHPEVDSVTQVDLDNLVTEMSLKYFPELCKNNQDPRVQLIFADGIDYLQQIQANSFDLIMIDSTGAGRDCEELFSPTFYRSCFSALNEQGIVVQQSGSPLLHQSLIKTIRTNMQQVGFNQTETLLFPQPIYPSGYWSCTMATKAADYRQFRDADAAKMSQQLEYYNLAIHKLSCTLPNFLAKHI